MKRFASLPIIVIGIILLAAAVSGRKFAAENERVRWWSFQSVDTMKYSRDTAREKRSDDPSLRAFVDRQIGSIAKTGATHVAIATPYDEEFLPVLRLWVDVARRHGLSVWFRGNWSGWEKWFNYPPISRGEHLEKTKQFISSHPDLFADGDVFSACPECENGGPGDPRRTGDAKGHKKFLIDEYQMMHAEFARIGKKVTAGFNSMNGDVARLIMDKETTAALGGYVVVDHYVGSTEKLASDVKDFAQRSGGYVILGEFGAPIPDLHGKMSQEEQDKWISEALTKLVAIPQLHGVNYWTNVGGSTALWESDGTARKAVETLRGFYRPRTLSGTVRNAYNAPLTGMLVKTDQREASTGKDGLFSLPVIGDKQGLTISGDGYRSHIQTIDGTTQSLAVTLLPEHETPFAWLLRKLYEVLF